MSLSTTQAGARLAQGYINRLVAAGVTPTTAQKGAVRRLARALEAIGLSKFTAVYPLVGGTAAAHALDLMGAYPITWAGTVTHNSAGATSNGTTGYGDTGLNPTTAGRSQNSGHFAFYVTGSVGAGSSVQCGLDSPSPMLGGWVSGGTLEGGQWTGSPGTYAGASPATEGFHVCSRTGASLTRYFVNGTQRGTDNTAASTSIGTENFYVLCYNAGGGASTPAAFSARTSQFHSFGAGLTDAEAARLAAAVEAFQVALGREA